MVRFKMLLTALEASRWLNKSMGRVPLSAFACDPGNTSTITNFFASLTSDLMLFALAMAAFFFALAALFYMASGATGNERTRTHAVNSLYAALAGLGLALLAGIVNNAAGGPPAQQAQMFRRFARAENARLRGIGGTGLGLYLCRELVEQHQGRIWFESREGKGTTFFLTLPLFAEKQEDEEAEAEHLDPLP